MKANFNGPVQINVARDLIVCSGSRALAADLDPVDPVDVPTYGRPNARALAALEVLVEGVWFLLKAAFWLAIGVLVAAVMLPAMAFAIVLWMTARVASLLLLVERGLGGGPTQIVYLPLLRKREVLELEEPSDETAIVLWDK